MPWKTLSITSGDLLAACLAPGGYTSIDSDRDGIIDTNDKCPYVQTASVRMEITSSMC